jgi:hypothetical protein
VSSYGAAADFRRQQRRNIVPEDFMRNAMLFFTGLLFCVLCSCVSVRTAGISFEIPEDFAGIIHTGYSNDLDTEYERLARMGALWVHRDFSWSTIEPADNVWNFSVFDAYVERANSEHKKILGMLLYDVDWIHDGTHDDDKFKDGRSHDYVSPSETELYCEYVRETVKRYNGKNNHGKVDAWAIWNEPNLKQFWEGTKEEFFALSTAAVRTIRSLDEEEGTRTTIIGGVLSDAELVFGNTSWVTGLFESGAMDGTDGVAFHPYHMSAGASARVFNRFRNITAQYGFADKIWVNEIGFPTRSSFPNKVKEAKMPETVAKTITLLAAGGARTFFWYQMFDGDSYGLVDNAASPWREKGGYWAYVLCANNLPGKTLRAGKYQHLSAPHKTQSFYFEGNNGSRVLIMWNESIFFNKRISVTLPGSNQKRWDVVTGNAVSVSENYTATLYRRGQNQAEKPSLIFLTWDE